MGCMDDPLSYYGYRTFDLLSVGTKITDMIVSLDNSNLIATDKTNNSILIVDIENEMSIRSKVWVGSEPTSLDISSDGSLVCDESDCPKFECDTCLCEYTGTGAECCDAAALDGFTCQMLEWDFGWDCTGCPDEPSCEAIAAGL